MKFCCAAINAAIKMRWNFGYRKLVAMHLSKMYSIYLKQS